MTFDLRTIYAMTALACFVLGLMQAAVFMSGRFDRWLAWWSVSNIVLGIGNFCITLRGSASDLITIQLGNLMVIAGCLLMPAAMRMFAGRSANPVCCCLLIGFLHLPMLLAFPVAEAARERIIYGSLVSALLDLAVAYEASRLARSEQLYTAKLMAGLFATTAFLYLLRAGFGAIGLFGHGGLFEGGSNNHAIMGLFAMVFLALRGMLIVLMAAERSANQLKEAAHHDALTGVLNRGGLLNALQSGPPDRMALLLVDLDHFKQLNDTGGHALGDSVLRTFAATAGSVIGPRDLVARHGGDEFVILLRHDDAARAIETAERLRLAFSRALEEGGEAFSVWPTLSIGVAVEAAHGEPLEALLHRADQALYRVKRRGRDGADIHEADAERKSAASGFAERHTDEVWPEVQDVPIVSLPPVAGAAGGA